MFLHDQPVSLNPSPAYWILAASLARGGETAWTPPHAGQLPTKVIRTKGASHPWHLVASPPSGSVRRRRAPPWACATNSTSSRPSAKGPPAPCPLLHPHPDIVDSPFEKQFLPSYKPSLGKSLTWVKETAGDRRLFFWREEKGSDPGRGFPERLELRTGHDTASSCTPKHRAKSLHARQSGVLHITPPLCSHNFL
jgi:hypothetical protein